MAKKANDSRAWQSGAFPRHAFLVIFVPVTIMLLASGYLFVSLLLEYRFESMLSSDRERLHTLRGYLSADGRASAHHITALAKQKELVRVLEDDRPAHIKALQAEFVEFAQRNPQYQQIRWIEENGLERIRVSRYDEDLVVAAPEQLQDKSGRYYFQESAKLLQGEIYISRIDLNIEHEQIELPLRPMVRILSPLFDQAHQRRGALVLNATLEPLFAVATQGYVKDGPDELLFVNNQGTLLNSEDEKANLDSLNFAALHSRLWENMKAEPSAHLEADQAFWTWQRAWALSELIQPQNDPRAMDPTFRIIRNDAVFYLLAQRSVESVRSMRMDAWVLGTMGTILTVMIFGLTLFFYLRGHARASHAEINTSKALLRAARAEKEKELEQRFHRLVEASSVGQLVLDDQANIRIANRAICELLGYQPSDLIDHSVDLLVHPDFRSQHATLRDTYLQDPQARKMGQGQIFEAMHKDGSSVRVEVGLNPYQENGQQRLLVNVIAVRG